MAQVLVRDLDPNTLERLKKRAKEHGRSLDGEVKAILESAATLTMEEARKAMEQLRRRFAGRMTSDSSDLVREDRDR